MIIETHLALFAAAFLAATILPFSSEVALLAAWAAHPDATWSLLAVAGFGNVLGACVNYALGRWLSAKAGRPWFPVSPAMLARASAWYAKFGVWSLLLSWLPVIGDPLTVAAGLMRTSPWRFLLLVGLAKVGRYLALLGGATAFAAAP